MTPEIERLLENLEADIQRAQFHSEPDLFYSALTLALLDLDRLRSSLSAQRPEATPGEPDAWAISRKVDGTLIYFHPATTPIEMILRAYSDEMYRVEPLFLAPRESGDDTPSELRGKYSPTSPPPPIPERTP